MSCVCWANQVNILDFYFFLDYTEAFQVKELKNKIGVNVPAEYKDKRLWAMCRQ